MTTLELKLNLPDSLAKEAARMGLLDPDSLRALLREAVRNRRIAQLAKARENIAAAGVAPLTMEEIQAEIEADRAERAEATHYPTQARPSCDVRHCRRIRGGVNPAVNQTDCRNVA